MQLSRSLGNFLEVNPQGIKCALAKEGLSEDVLRLPLLSVASDTAEEIYFALDQIKLNQL